MNGYNILDIKNASGLKYVPTSIKTVGCISFGWEYSRGIGGGSGYTSCSNGSAYLTGRMFVSRPSASVSLTLPVSEPVDGCEADLTIAHWGVMLTVGLNGISEVGFSLPGWSVGISCTSRVR